MRRLIFALAVVAAACGGPTTDSGDSTTSTSSATITTTTTTPSTTTSTAPPGPIVMSTGTNTFFEPGVAYRAEFLPVPVEFEFDEPGWRTVTIQSALGFIEFRNQETELDGPLSLGLSYTTRSQTETLDSLRSDPHALDVTPIAPSPLGGLSAATFEVTVPPTYNLGPSPCTGAVGLVDFGTAETGPFQFGLLGCARNRVWVANHDGQSILIWAGLITEDDSSIAGLEPVEDLLDDFINAITFCTEATPCDD